MSDWGMRKALCARAASWHGDGGHKDGRRLLRRTAGKTQQVELRGECYTDVVTRSVAWLTWFLLESSPLAAFMSFRKFSTVFFMFFNSPGCGVARLWRVLCKQTEARGSGFIHCCVRALAFQYIVYSFRNPQPREAAFFPTLCTHGLPTQSSQNSEGTSQSWWNTLLLE